MPCDDRQSQGVRVKSTRANTCCTMCMWETRISIQGRGSHTNLAEAVGASCPSTVQAGTGRPAWSTSAHLFLAPHPGPPWACAELGSQTEVRARIPGWAWWGGAPDSPSDTAKTASGRRGPSAPTWHHSGHRPLPSSVGMVLSSLGGTLSQRRWRGMGERKEKQREGRSGDECPPAPCPGTPEAQQDQCPWRRRCGSQPSGRES